MDWLSRPERGQQALCGERKGCVCVCVSVCECVCVCVGRGLGGYCVEGEDCGSKLCSSIQTGKGPKQSFFPTPTPSLFISLSLSFSLFISLSLSLSDPEGPPDANILKKDHFTRAHDEIESCKAERGEAK